MKSKALALIVLAAAALLQAACRKAETQPSQPTTQSGPIPSPDGWVAMEGLAPGQWMPIDGAAELEWKQGDQTLWVDFGHDLNGVRWTGELPSAPYELELEARRLSGNDFFCALTFPVRSEEESVTFISGGWGGELVGISSIDGRDASENSTASSQSFEGRRWYRIRVRVETHRLQAWIDDRIMVSEDITGRHLSLREGQIRDCAPLGLATWATRAEMRGMRWRTVGNGE